MWEQGAGEGTILTEQFEGEGSLAGLHIPIQIATLANGLRVVVSPESTAPLVTVGVYYNIGFRLEPQGRSGFAHLFEHMMFQGSENAGKMVHIQLINASGGLLNGTTNYDVTNYFETVPSNALERVLWLEADRMRALKVDGENLLNQRDVVKEEVRVNVLNQPYGGFPWLDLPPVAFRNWANAHNFYGDFADLDAATLEDVRTFFKTYYSPSNAILVILGDVVPAEALALAEKYFGHIPAGKPAPKADASEPPQTEERFGEVPEKFGPLPAIAIGYTFPPRTRLFVDEGEFVSVVGLNGAGKTTLFNAISGLVPYAGTVAFGDRALAGRTPAAIARDGIVQCPESRQLFGDMTVRENLDLGGQHLPAEARAEQLAWLFELFPILESRQGQVARTLSGGEQQMLAIARALMMRPKLLILDEPTLGLAPVILEQLSKALKRLRASTPITVLLGEQNVTFALPHADRVYLLEHARVAWEGQPAEFAAVMGEGYL